jgi:elongation factor Ts
MTTTIEYIQQLRAQTGAGILECHRALEESDYLFEPALLILRENAAKKAVQKADRETSQGMVEVYTHNSGRIGVMLEVNCETDFTARSEKFRAFAHELALHIISVSPLWVSDKDIPMEVLDGEREKVIGRARAEGKPEALLARIGDGAVEKYRNRTVLLRQPSLRDEAVTVGQMVSQMAEVTGENICVRRFVRWELAQTVSQPAGE